MNRQPLRVEWPVRDRNTGEVFAVTHWPRESRWECGRCGQIELGRICVHVLVASAKQFQVGEAIVHEQQRCECGASFLGEDHRDGCPFMSWS